MLQTIRVTFLLLGWILILTVGTITVHGKVCRIDATIDFRANPDNVYNCNEDQDCCVEGGKPSCCSNKDADEEALDQVKLWGGVIGAAVAVGILICCCRRDSECCEGDEDCKYYVTCGCCSNSKKRSSKDDVEYERFSPPESPSHSAVSTVSHGKDEGFLWLDQSVPLERAAPTRVQQLQEIRAEDLADRLNAP